MKTYRAAVLGLGRMGNTIDDEVKSDPSFPLPYSVPGSIVGSERLELVAGCDLLPEKRAAFRERWGVETLHEDYLEMIEQEQPDLVAICTRADVHAELGARVAEAGVPMIYLEKAIACSMREADALLGACRQHGTAFNSGVLNRFNNLFWAARDLIKTGEIGEPRVALHYAHRTLLHGHTIDALSYLLGDPKIVAVRGELEPRELKIEHNRVDDDPRATFQLVFADGAEACTIPAGVYEFELTGSEGAVRTLNNGSGLALRKPTPTEGRRVQWDVAPVPAVERKSAVVACLEDLEDAHEQGRPALNHIELAHHITEACLAVAESHRQGGAWVDLPFENRDLYVYHV